MTIHVALKQDRFPFMGNDALELRVKDWIVEEL